ncbi:hypothetical protein K469DRAFT_245511 [Zopfia rhizophila CBS 207.26]|uniref:Uncharacterized protein n=1 Tax=Zopfia rhizophila CBS 207.26 TaxID=1314779 RepID=A0A6A6DR99_9PEZI|nr:hypothetical protein K469DRAFT_245511 [Zopfia rhizophila CBS 207.26]
MKGKSFGGKQYKLSSNICEGFLCRSLMCLEVVWLGCGLATLGRSMIGERAQNQSF